MGTGAALVLQLLVTALEHTTELVALLNTAKSEGRDVTDDELKAVSASATASLDKLAAAKKPDVPVGKA